MKIPVTQLFCRISAIAILIGLLAACTPPPVAPPTSNLTLDMRRMQSALDRQEQSIQDLTAQIASLDSRLQSQSEALEQLRQAQQQQQPSVAPPATTAPTTAVPGPAAVPAQIDGSPTEIYLQAFGDYASGRYQSAIHGFTTFLQRFPNNSYASNAQYWLGDCYFNQQQYPRAIQEFERVLNDYPSAPKSPDALLKIAVAQLQLGATVEARQAVETLSRRYPKSPAAQKAQELAIP